MAEISLKKSRLDEPITRRDLLRGLAPALLWPAFFAETLIKDQLEKLSPHPEQDSEPAGDRTKEYFHDFFQELYAKLVVKQRAVLGLPSRETYNVFDIGSTRLDMAVMQSPPVIVFDIIFVQKDGPEKSLGTFEIRGVPGRRFDEKKDFEDPVLRILAKAQPAL